MPLPDMLELQLSYCEDNLRRAKQNSDLDADQRQRVNKAQELVAGVYRELEVLKDEA